MASRGYRARCTEESVRAAWLQILEAAPLRDQALALKRRA
jgi:hypothetical protein